MSQPYPSKFPVPSTSLKSIHYEKLLKEKYIYVELYIAFSTSFFLSVVTIAVSSKS